MNKKVGRRHYEMKGRERERERERERFPLWLWSPANQEGGKQILFLVVPKLSFFKNFYLKR